MKKIILVLMLLIVHSTMYIEYCSAQVWSPLGSGMNGSVTSFAIFNNELIAGGYFTTAGGVSANRIAKWNGTNWAPLGSGLDSWVASLTVYNNELIAGGDFTTAGGISAKYIAKWNGTSWSPLGSGLNNGVWTRTWALTVYNNELIAGGQFDSAGGVSAQNIAKWNGTNWSPLGSGLVFPSAGPTDAVYALTIYNNELIAGGDFTNSGSTILNRVAKWNGTNWSPIGGGIGGLGNPIELLPKVHSLTIFNNNLIVGGDFTIAGTVSARNIAKWNGFIWSPLDSGMNHRVAALTAYNNELFAGGTFDTAGRVKINYLAKWNGTNWSPIGSGIDSGVNKGIASFYVLNNDLIVGGIFTTAGGVLLNNIAKWGAGFTISGNVRYSDNNQPATNGYVKAIKLDRNTSNIITYDSVQIQNDGSYTLTQVPQDSIDIGVYPNSTTQNDWVITYYPSTTYWQDATTLYPTGNLTNINIGVKRLSSSTASNSVNGKVMRLTDAQIGNLKDAVLYAKNGNTFVRCAMSDGNGVYHLPSLPTGSLKIICNRLGFTGDSTTVNVTSTSNIDSINFYLYKLPLGIKQIGSTVPSEYKLYQNYPNPFNPTTSIKYSVSSIRNVKLIVYDILGKEVSALVNEKQSPGMYEVTFDGSGMSSGIYFYKLATEDFSEVRRMILIK